MPLISIGLLHGWCTAKTIQGHQKESAAPRLWHKNQFGRIAGRLYIAWCAAAVGLPVLAGALFDRSGSYASTVWVAAGINVLGMLVAAGCLRGDASRIEAWVEPGARSV